MKERTLIRDRIIVVVIALALALGTTVALTGCQSKEQQAEAAVKSLLDDYKDGAVELLNSTESSELDELGIDKQELASAMTEDFSYEVKGAKKNSETGNIDVEVTIHSKQLVSAIKNALPDMMSYAFSAAFSGLSQDDIQKQLANIIIEQLKDEEAVETTITVPTQEESGDVLATTEGKQAITNAILGDVDALQQSLSTGVSELDEAA